MDADRSLSIDALRKIAADVIRYENRWTRERYKDTSDAELTGVGGPQLYTVDWAVDDFAEADNR